MVSEKAKGNHNESGQKHHESEIETENFDIDFILFFLSAQNNK